MDQLPDRENTNFPLAVRNALNGVDKEDKFLLYHQILPITFFTSYPKMRGILMMHETGTGKSIDAVAIADSFRKQGRRPIVIAPKTLQNNFKQNIVKYKMMALGVDTEKLAKSQVDAEYSFVSANANNMMAQLRNVSQPAEIQAALDDEFEDSGQDNTSSNSISLEGTIVIIDEAHNLFNGIVSGSKNAHGLYDVIMRTNDIKLVFLTSNVIINTPFEIVPCFNMIAGRDLLPTNYMDFMDMYIDEKSGMAKNVEYLKARIFGLSSYYGSLYQTGGLLNIHMSVERDGLPTRLPIKEVLVPMSISQYSSYTSARDKELLQKSFSKGNTPNLNKPKSATGSTYRVHSRQFSNFWPGENKTDLIDSVYDNLESHSPKFAAILDNIHKHGKSVGIVYSAFVQTFGLKWFAKMLDVDGYELFKPFEYESINGTKKKRYAFITGDMSPDERSAVLLEFNSDENKTGDIIHILLGSPAMAEGVDTKRVRHVHIVEAPWHFSNLEQVIARAVRFGSHIDLPEGEKNVQAYIYLSDYPKGIEKKSEPTTDVMLYYKSIKKKILNDQFFKALVETSIDCGIHIESASKSAKDQIRCMLCVPDNKRLFDTDYTAHLKRPLACRQSEAKNVTVEEIEFNSRMYYYSKGALGSVKIYEYDKPTSSYIQMLPSSKWYEPIFLKLTKS
jgi:superfamily II DNA or RNA helicase